MTLPREKEKMLVIVGPTATGKSELAVSLAKKFNGEVISADSRQVYHELDKGSGKITKIEMQGVPHHLLSIADPKDTFTAADFKRLAEKKIRGIVGRGKIPIIAGGTGFYIQALVDGIAFPEVGPDEDLRAKLETEPVEDLYEKLLKLDPKRAETIDSKNKRRLIRAIEIAKTIGSVPNAETRASNYDPLFIGIDLPDAELKEKIHERLISRIENGMIEEVEKLHTEGLSWKRLEELGLEYRYVAEYLQKKLSRDKMLEKIETESWLYVKRQRTWFRRDRRITWFDPKQKEDVENKVDAFLAHKKK